MKNTLTRSFLTFAIVSSCTLFAQEVTHHSQPVGISQEDAEILKGFDENAVIAELKARGIPEMEFRGIIRSRKAAYLNEKKGISQKQTISFSQQKATIGPCDNASFEDGTFTNWTGASGFVPSTSWTPGFVSNGLNAAASDPLARHTILNAAGFDPNAISMTTGLPEIPLIAPGGNTVSVRLGNAVNGAETERLQYPITVTPSNTSFTYQYAVVLESPTGHTAAEQPRFDIRVIDATGTVVSGPCGVYAVEGLAAAGDTTFHPFEDPTFPGTIQGYYKRWTAVSIDLTPYIGTTVTIEFQTSDCTLSGHYGYAYIDATCSQLAASVAFCPNDTMLLLTAPGGFNSYQWYDPSANPISAAAGGTNDTLVILNPVLGLVYSVSMLSASGCGTSLTVTLAYSDITVNTNVFPVTCFGDNDGYAYATPSGAIPPFTYSWVDSTSGSVISTNDSLLNAVAGTYYVTVSSLGGCFRTDTLHVAQPPNPGDTLGIGTVFCPGDPRIVLNAPAGFTTYQWYADATGTGAVIGNLDSLVVGSPVAGMVFTVVMQNPGSCPVFLTTNLNYSPPPALPDYIVKSNVFTPNGDLKNDKFDLNQFAFVAEFHIEIYNRWGKKVFESDDLSNQWDGKIKGKEADEGVYFWLAHYKSSCTADAKQIENKGFVQLLRN